MVSCLPLNKELSTFVCNSCAWLCGQWTCATKVHVTMMMISVMIMIVMMIIVMVMMVTVLMMGIVMIIPVLGSVEHNVPYSVCNLYN